MREAVKLGSGVPQVLMRVANFHFARGENDKAIQQTRRVLEMGAEYDSIIFSYYRRLGIPVHSVLDSGLPESSRAWQSYFRDLLRWADVEVSALAWERSVEHFCTDDELAGDYVSYLMRRRLYDKSATTWATHLGARQGEYRISNLIFNGDFEREPSGVPLDWQIRSAGGAACRLSSEPPDSNRFLELEFDGTENVAFQHVSQLVPVDPGSYRLRLRLRTRQITTDRGIYARVFDPSSPRLLDVKGEEFIGANDWTDVELPFRVAAGTEAVVVQLCRDPSMRIDNKIWGTVWVDDVSITRTGT